MRVGVNRERPQVSSSPALRGLPFVKERNKAFHAKRSVVNLQSVQLLGVEIPKAILLQSNKVAA